MIINNTVPPHLIALQVKLALEEDIGREDVTAMLIPSDKTVCATITSHDNAVLCGQAWLEQVFTQLDSAITIEWHLADGDKMQCSDTICTLKGHARTLLKGERSAINFLQTLSATATSVSHYVEQVSGLAVHIVDTRKTIPGLRLAQKYAVRCGGGYNHRIGLYDSILIKENHINAASSIQQAVDKAKCLYPDMTIEVEVENIDELWQALAAGATVILLDNFTIPELEKAVMVSQGKALLEASGNIELCNVKSVAQTGVDRISVGALTKNITAIDISMRFQ